MITKNNVTMIKNLWDSDNHMYALIHLATLLEQEKYRKILINLQEIHFYQEFIPESLFNYRAEVQQELLLILKKQYYPLTPLIKRLIAIFEEEGG